MIQINVKNIIIIFNNIYSVYLFFFIDKQTKNRMPSDHIINLSTCVIYNLYHFVCIEIGLKSRINRNTNSFLQFILSFDNE